MTNFSIQGRLPNIIQGHESRVTSRESNNCGVSFNQVVAEMKQAGFIPNICAGEQKNELTFLKHDEKVGPTDIFEEADPEELICGIKKILEELCK